jgi:hypothetical protein
MRFIFIQLRLLLMLAFGLAGGIAQTKQPVTAGERQTVDLTVYNQNLSLVREERGISLPRGFSRIIIPEIPATIDGTSLHFRSLTDPSAVRVLEQNYQYDLVHQGRLLEKYLGKEVEFVRLNEETKKQYVVSGKLLSTGYVMRGGYPGSAVVYDYAGGMVAEINGKIELNPIGQLILPSLPEGLILKPQLEWLVSSTRAGDHKTEISYLAGGLAWGCDYVALLDKNDTNLDLTGWVTLTNNSGSTFRNASLKLVAGDVNIVKKDMEMNLREEMAASAVDAARPQFSQSELFEYKLYTLERRTDVNNNETKQIELVSGRDVPAKKAFIYDGLADQWHAWFYNSSYRSQGSFGQQSNPKVGVYMTFRNEEKSGLGIPLPKGKVRVYKQDNDGKEQFIGEDQIDHTPKDEEVRLYLGNAFDIVGERVQKDFRSYANGHVVEETVEIKVRNHKKEPVSVQVVEHPWRWSQWEILRSSVDWTKVDQTTLRFPLVIATDGESVVTYTIRYSW